MEQEYRKDGYYLVKGAFTEEEVTALKDELTVFQGKVNNYGVRNLMSKVPYIRGLAYSTPLLNIANEILGKSSRPVRSVYFDKVPGANWNVA